MDEQTKAAFAAELKEQLQRSVENVTKENDDDNLDEIDEAMKSLSVLKDLAIMSGRGRKKEVVPLGGMKKIDESQDQESCSATTSYKVVEQEEWLSLVPDGLKCPISGLLMVDPVVISSGQTYDNQSIQKWFEDGNQTCPKTDEKLAHTRLIPNISVKKLILLWCEENNVPAPTTLSTGDEEWLSLVPDEFKCPLSGSLMVEPVVISSGQTYNKQSIQKWFEDGHQKCPKTGEKLAHTLLIPNNSVKKLILLWCEQNNVPAPTTLSTGDEECEVDTANQEYLVTLLEKLSSSISDARGAAKELQTLTNKLPSVRALVSDDTSGVITRLFSQLLLDVSGLREELQEKLVSTLLSISVHENNSNKVLQDIPAAISFLTKCLKDERIETRMQAAATVRILSEVDSNRNVIGNSGAIKPLIKLIKEGHPLALQDAVSAILSLCTLPENREIAISEGAVIVIVRKMIPAHILLYELLEILLVLCRQQTAIDQVDEHRGIHALFRLLNDKNVNEQQKGACVAILYSICCSDERKVKSIWEADVTGEILSHIVATGSVWTKTKAVKIVKRLDMDKDKPYRRDYRV